MSETKEPEAKKPLKLNRPGRLELKKTVETAPVRQSFSHGRSKTVQVEVKRTRSFERGAGGRMAEVKAEEAEQPVEAKPAQPEKAAPAPKPSAPARTLTEHERQARARAVEVAKQEEELRAREAEREAKRQAEAEAEAARIAAEAEAKRQAEKEALDKLEAEEAERKAAKVDSQAVEPEVVEAPAERAAPPAGKKRAAEEAEPAADLAEELGGRVKRKGAPAKGAPARRPGEPRRRQGKLTITQALDSEEEEARQRSLASVRRAREREKQRQLEMQGHQPPSRVIREVVIPETLTVQELANRMAERGGEVVKVLMKMGVMATINQAIDADTAELVVSEFGHKSKRVSASDVELGLRDEHDDDSKGESRPPVVTVMGHVDHGKTSLLDALRQTDVAAQEAGGITQHIGAYQVHLKNGNRITFIDTPGHAAFTEMRARGATVTDLVVLVVAADDGIMEQTVEAINHAKAAKVPMIVAINKMDRPNADPDRVKQELLQHEIVVEEMGGDVLAVPVSALKREGLETLEENILLQAELLELKANPERNAEGVVIEAKLEQGRGPVATILVQRGTLHVGDIFVVGSEWGRVRALINDRGERVEEAGPSTPVEVLGLQGTPLAGDDFVAVESESKAREVAEFRSASKRDRDIAISGRGTLEQMLSRIKEGETKELPVVVKADVQGSLEAIVTALERLSTEEVGARVLHAGVGGVNESDVTLARASNAIIIAFNVRANAQAREVAKRDNVDIRYYSIIYNVVDDMKAALSGMLSPEQAEKFLGYAEIREIFDITKVGKVAGCMVTDGLVKRGAKVRLLRDNVVIHDGTLKTLRRFKEEVREVKEGYECGMAFENYQDIQVGDQIECYEIEEKAREL
jgi:translation initiation factor IF-2